MKLVYRAATGSPLHCIAFHGITVLHEHPQQGLFLVFGLATGGTVEEYLQKFGNTLQWDDLIDFFNGIATGLAELHQRGMAHGLAFMCILEANRPQRPP
jgi:serine/threonine protein kinase